MLRSNLLENVGRYLRAGILGCMLFGGPVLAFAYEKNPVADLTAKLTAEWWQWSISMPLTEHPFLDPAPNDCKYKQSSGVWFLGGVFNAAAVERNCIIPRGITLLVPAVNVDCSNVEAFPFFGATPKKRLECVKAFEFTNPFVRIGGVKFDPQYVISPEFRFDAPKDNVLGVVGPVSGKAVSAGYWALIPPLAPGDYILRFGGAVVLGAILSFNQDITYNLHVND